MKKNVAEFWDQNYLKFDPTAPVEGELFLPDGGSIQGKNCLIVACGTGQQVVRACRAGAVVMALDVSKQAINNAKSMLNFHQLKADFIVTDAADTKLPAGTFNVIWGSAVLHHLDHEMASMELHRLLSPGGVAYFVSEPTFFNPILKFAYSICFGLNRNSRRNKFLFFKRIGDDYEMPITKSDILVWSRYFDVQLLPNGFMFFEKIAHVSKLPEFGKLIFINLDRGLSKLFPFLRKWSYEYHFVFKKK